MTSNRFGPRFVPLRYDCSRVFVPFTEISRTEAIALGDRLETARRDLLHESSTGGIENADSRFVNYPEQMLAEYQAARRESSLGQILAKAKQLRESVDRVLIVSGGIVLAQAQAMFHAGCHPYHNELSRGDRGGRPRFYFAGNDFDNDAIEGLLDLVRSARHPATVDESWAILCIFYDRFTRTRTVDTIQQRRARLAVEDILLAALRESCGGDDSEFASRLYWAYEDNEVSIHAYPPPPCTPLLLPVFSSGRGALFAAAGLFPASLMGIDIVALLKGGAMMTELFRTAPPGENPVLDYAAAAFVASKCAHTAGRRIKPWASAIGAAAEWAELLHRNPELRDCRPTPPGGVHTNLIVDAVRRDRIIVPLAPGQETDGPLAIRGVGLPEHQMAAVRSANSLLAIRKHPAADLHLPTLEESSLGQFFQMMLLATEIGSRLVETNCP